MDTIEDEETDRETNVIFLPHPRVLPRAQPARHVEPRLPLPAPVRGRPAPAPLRFLGKPPGTTPGIERNVRGTTPSIERGRGTTPDVETSARRPTRIGRRDRAGGANVPRERRAQTPRIDFERTPGIEREVRDDDVTRKIVIYQPR